MQPRLAQFADTCRQFWGVLEPPLMAAYAGAGAPYGPGVEGMIRWMEHDAGPTYRAQQEAAEQAEWDWSMAVFGTHVREHLEPDDPHCPHCRTVRYNRSRVTA